MWIAKKGLKNDTAPFIDFSHFPPLIISTKWQPSIEISLYTFSLNFNFYFYFFHVDLILNKFQFLLAGLTRPALYPFPASQYAYPMLSPEMTAASWHTPSMYSAASGFRSPYPSSLPINTTLSR